VVAWRAVVRWQFDLAWALLDFHLERLQPDDFLWEPSPHCFTVRPDADGVWVADWEEPEPDQAPNPTIAWLTWHIGWWWTVTIAHVQQRTPPERSDVNWPGDGPSAVAWLQALRPQWLSALDGLKDGDLEAVAPFPWYDNPERTVAHMVAWVNAELMKNAAEIGMLRLLRASRKP
jgi:DinB family protein